MCEAVPIPPNLPWVYLSSTGHCLSPAPLTNYGCTFGPGKSDGLKLNKINVNVLLLRNVEVDVM